MKRLKYIILLITCMGLISCNNKANTTDWIKNAKKPITVFEVDSEFSSGGNYVLIDSALNVHQTGRTILKLPKIIK